MFLDVDWTTKESSFDSMQGKSFFCSESIQTVSGAHLSAYLVGTLPFSLGV
jgi:hypothetical protein